jgi:hypothetical protein
MPDIRQRLPGITAVSLLIFLCFEWPVTSNSAGSYGHSAELRIPLLLPFKFDDRLRSKVAGTGRVSVIRLSGIPASKRILAPGKTP